MFFPLTVAILLMQHKIDDHLQPLHSDHQDEVAHCRVSRQMQEDSRVSGSRMARSGDHGPYPSSERRAGGDRI